MWVLRVRSGRGPTLRTARRGTISTWLGQRDWPQLSDPVSLLPDQRAPEPLVASAPSPEFPFGLELKGRVGTWRLNNAFNSSQNGNSGEGADATKGSGAR